MAAKKTDIQKEINKLFNQAKEKFKVFRQELSTIAQKSEKEIVKASKTGKIQFDIMGLTVQKEKLYYDIGKKVASLRSKKNLAMPELEQCWGKMRQIEKDIRRKKRELAGIKRNEK